MPLNETETYMLLIEPKFELMGWDFGERLRFGPGRVNFTVDGAESMYDPKQLDIADYLFRYRGLPLGVLKVKSEAEDAEDGKQQATRYAARLMIRHLLATNGHDWILTDHKTGEYETISAPPSPQDFINRLEAKIDWDRWEGASAANLLSIEVPAPPLEVQGKVIEALCDQQKSVVTLRGSLIEADAESSRIRESILHRAFAGEL